MKPHLDIRTILTTSLKRWWQDFAPITLLGLALIVGTELVIHAVGANGSTAESTGTLVLTARAFAFLLFFSAVAAATLASRLPLSPRAYILTGLRGAQPPLVTGLTVAAGLICVLIVGQLLALFLTPLARLLAMPPLLGLVILWCLAMPVAAAEKKVPFAAMKRSQQMAWRHMGSLCGLAAIIVALLTLPLMLISLVLYGYAPTPEEARATLDAMTPATTAFWVGELAVVILSGILAVIPPAIYIALSDAAQGRNDPQPLA
ncbi:MAG: hypothetical protein WA979_03115 [Pacificimonas sp.]